MNQKYDTDKFILKSKEIHINKYDYSQTNYKAIEKPVIIICPIHGEFEQIPRKHLMGRGCKICGRLKGSSSKTYSNDEFISKSKEQYPEKYSYDKLEYINTRSKVTITCKEHGDFIISPNKHFTSAHGGCKKCVASMSRYATLVNDFLIENNIKFRTEQSFPGCLSPINYKLRFDFYLPDYNICIEYDGGQHDRAVPFYGGQAGFEKRQVHDQIKDKYCLENKIGLVRIKTQSKLEINKLLTKLVSKL